VLFPDLPGCVTQGQDMAEAQEMAVEAMSGWIAVTAENGGRLPDSRSLEAIRADKAFAKAHGFNWRNVAATLIPSRS
jgi:predicted RNase H-like HicB family nuclease